MNDKVKGNVYIAENLKPIFFGLFAYRFKWKDTRTIGYYGISVKYGYRKIVWQIFVLWRRP